MNIINEEKFSDMRWKMYFIEGNKGKNSDIYKMENTVVKMFYNPKDMTEQLLDKYDILSKLESNRFVMLKDIICIDNKVVGITMPYIDNNITSIDNINMYLLLNELKIIKKDIISFTEKRIAIRDCHSFNLIFNDKLNIIDTDDYIPLSNCPKFFETLPLREKSYNLYNLNLYQINTGIIYFLSKNLSNRFTSSDKTKFNLSLYNGLKELNGQYYTYIGEYLERDISKNESIEEYAKRKIKQTTNTIYFL